MLIRRATISDLPQLYVFNHRMYPERDNYKEIIDFWISKGAKEIENIIIVIDDDGRIRGQQFFSSMSYYYNGEEINSTWAFDLIVDEELRAGSYGFSLMWKCKRLNPNSMSSGSNDISLPINIKIGNKHIGDLRKFVGITNPLYVFTSVLQVNAKSKDFPKSIKVENGSFMKIENKKEMPSYSVPFNTHLLEISRKYDFLLWRYFSNLHDYVFYKRKDSDDYFVVRTIVKHHISALVLVDYRCQFTVKQPFESIMSAFVELASKMKFFIYIVGSSLSIVDKTCAKFHMKAIGRDRPILGLINNDVTEEEREMRNYILLTLADTDGDITW